MATRQTPEAPVTVVDALGNETEVEQWAWQAMMAVATMRGRCALVVRSMTTYTPEGTKYPLRRDQEWWLPREPLIQLGNADHWVRIMRTPRGVSTLIPLRDWMYAFTMNNIDDA